MFQGKTVFTKLCHAPVGSRIKLVDSEMKIGDEVFIVGAIDKAGQRPARKGLSLGLYDDQRQLFLMNAASGMQRSMPHLSSRVVILKSDEVGAVEKLALMLDRPKTAEAFLEEVVEELAGLDLDRPGFDAMGELLTLACKLRSFSDGRIDSDKNRFGVALIAGKPRRFSGPSLHLVAGESIEVQLLGAEASLSMAIAEARKVWSDCSLEEFSVVVFDRSVDRSVGVDGGKVMARLTMSLQRAAGAKEPAHA